ncbi:hypothetical protein F441_22913 [Phytophthora nicotianae CJ01A1]|uniref:Uncharacterized protein n=2 Tax=Phytophthora nicotianae TaxID=4792 RepID=W2FUL1_PHYNI|nr:hypothetical protein L915_19348 [Phytophthora nicotianae]ETL27192.1 hypothetical protein L916_19237 [Phytophthora nicotianae]ETO99668.1 hypothetical protein F441_22913 [Phytophthora nicotianae CJ01A1]
MSTGGGTSTGPQYGSTKPPKYDEKGGFDLYRAMLESFRTQRERWGIVDGTDVLDAAKICTMTYARQMWLAFELETTKRNYSNSLFVHDVEAMRRQLRNMNETISDNETLKVVIQGVAHEYRGIVRMFDKEACDGNAPQPRTF